MPYVVWNIEWDGVDWGGNPILVADSSSLSITGDASSYFHDRGIIASYGSYTIGGQQTTFVRYLSFTVDSDTFAITGSYTRKSLAIAADSGSLSLSGSSSTRAIVLASTGDAFSLTGDSATISRHLSINAEDDSFSVSGSDADVGAHIVRDADAESFTLAGAPSWYQDTMHRVDWNIGWQGVSWGPNIFALDYIPFVLTFADSDLSLGRVLSSSSTNYLLTGFVSLFKFDRAVIATSDSYAISGSAASVVAGRNVGLDSGILQVNGAAAVLARDFNLQAVSASYAITGSAAWLSSNYVVNAQAESFALSYSDSLWVRSKILEAGSSALSITGSDSNKYHDRYRALDSSSLALSGQPSYAFSALSMDLDSESFVLTGSPTTAGYGSVAESGVYTYSGSPITVTRHRALPADDEALVITGSPSWYQDTMHRVDWNIDWRGVVWGINAAISDPGSHVISFEDASISKHLSVLAGSDSYTIAGQQAIAAAQRQLEGDATSYLTSGQSSTLTVAKTIVASSGNYVFAGADNVIAKQYNTLADSGEYTLTGAGAINTVERVLNSAHADFSITGADVPRSYNRTASNDVGSYAILGSAADKQHHRALQSASGSYTLSGKDVSDDIDKVLSATAGSFTLTGEASSLLLSRILESDSDSYLLSGASSNKIHDRVADANQGSYSATGADSTFEIENSVGADFGAYTIAGSSIAARVLRNLQAGVGTLYINGGTAILTYTDARGSLITLTIGGETHQVSTEGLALESYWDPRVFSLDIPQLRMDTEHGGYVAPGYGALELSLEAFDTQWPPPASIEVVWEYTLGLEVDAQSIFTGTAHLRSLTAESVVYDLFGPSYDYQVSDGTSFNDTLVNVVSWFCDASRLNLTLDSTYARSTSPSVDYTVDGDTIGIDLLSDICAALTHLFYIEDGTLYLIDMLGNKGERTVTEFDQMPAVYEMGSPVSSVGGDREKYNVATDYPYGEKYSPPGPYNSNQTLNEASYTDIVTILNRPRATLELTIQGTLPKPGEKINFVDESMPNTLTTAMYVRGLRYDFQNEVIKCDCDGTWS